MTWRRLTMREARAEALSEYRSQVYDSIETQAVLRELLIEEETKREAALAACRPILANMTSAQILDALHEALGNGQSVLPCHSHDVLSAVLDELERRKGATGHERLRLRNLDRGA